MPAKADDDPLLSGDRFSLDKNAAELGESRQSEAYTRLVGGVIGRVSSRFFERRLRSKTEVIIYVYEGIILGSAAYLLADSHAGSGRVFAI
jgi:hypothetical protein